MAKSNRVFISYSEQDKKWVREFVEKLATKGLDVWLDDLELPVGESIADMLEEGIRSSDSLVFILSPENIHSPNLFFELGAALGAGKRVIGVVDKDVLAKDLPGPIRKRRYLVKEQPEETARDVAEVLASAG